MRDRLQHAIQVRENLVVPEAQYAKAASFEQHRSCRCRVGVTIVLAAVQLDDQASIEADEVDDIVAHRMLSAEFAAGERPGA